MSQRPSWDDPDFDGLAGESAEDEVPVLDVSMLPEVVSELAATSERHDHVLAEHDSTLRDLGDSFAALEQSLAERVELTKPNRWTWQFLTAQEATQLWQELRWFVDQFTDRYALSSAVSLPPCWYRHTIAVDELTAVYAAWRDAYCGSDRPSADMITWWDRWLWPALHRLATHADWRECKETRRHVASTMRQDTTDEDFTTYAAANIAARPSHRSTPLPWPTAKSGAAPPSPARAEP